MTDVTSAVAAALGKLVDSGKIEAAISKQLEETIADVVKQQMRPYSDFGKAIESRVKEALAIDIGKLSLPTYNEIILDVIRKKLDAQITMHGRVELGKNLETLLSPAPKEIKLSKLVEDFKENLRFWHDEHGEELTLIVDKIGDYGSRWVYLDAKQDVSQYSCSVSFLVTRKAGIELAKGAALTEGVISNLKFKTQRENNAIFIGDFHSFERDLFNLHAAKSVIILDEDAVDRSMPEPECECDH